ncbi:MAG: hypothetical protein KDD69_06610 [Bdellovibrionales bacterium]|nr:hypothetical protein [Bdellovibrionales bacterium]
MSIVRLFADAATGALSPARVTPAASPRPAQVQRPAAAPNEDAAVISLSSAAIEFAGTLPERPAVPPTVRAPDATQQTPVTAQQAPTQASDEEQTAQQRDARADSQASTFLAQAQAELQRAATATASGPRQREVVEDGVSDAQDGFGVSPEASQESTESFSGRPVGGNARAFQAAISALAQQRPVGSGLDIQA